MRDGEPSCPKLCGLSIIKPRCESGHHSTCPYQPLPQAHPHSGLFLALLSACSVFPPTPPPASSSLVRCQWNGTSSDRCSLTTLSSVVATLPTHSVTAPFILSCAFIHHMKLFAELFLGCLAHKRKSSMKTGSISISHHFIPQA